MRSYYLILTDTHGLQGPNFLSNLILYESLLAHWYSSHSGPCKALCCLQLLFTELTSFPGIASLDSLNSCSLRSQLKRNLLRAVFPDHSNNNSPPQSLSQPSALFHYGICHLKSVYLLVYFFIVCLSLQTPLGRVCLSCIILVIKFSLSCITLCLAYIIVGKLTKYLF